MIPKIIHYCWFGGKEKPKSVFKMIDSWKKHCPKYTIKEWNESNFDVNYNQYTKEAYQCGKWAFVSDVARLYALYHEGGIYMDTDVEALTNYDQFLHHHAFSGFESDGNVPTGMMAAEKNSNWAKDLLEDYRDRRFINNDGSLDMTTNTTLITNYMLSKGLLLNNKFQDFPDLVTMYPSDYFCPKDHRTGQINLTSNSVCIHHFAGTWLEHKTISYRLYKLKTKLMSIFGVNAINKIITLFHLDAIKKKLLK